MNCAEHGMPQNLEDTEFPGATPKYMMLCQKQQSRDVIAIAPLYSQEQIAEAQAHAAALNLTPKVVAAVYSLSDLKRVHHPSELKVAEDIHEPGCIYSDQRHPGACYVKTSISEHAKGCQLAPDAHLGRPCKL